MKEKGGEQEESLGFAPVMVVVVVDGDYKVAVTAICPQRINRTYVRMKKERKNKNAQIISAINIRCRLGNHPQ
ncbi:hypothetical protein RB195_013296 [Necator americanus]|uniref:Uncharacterized protein n=1 Tax=Necator americanus TaxID=51031 RepID=A0ABR1DV18_NECAM